MSFYTSLVEILDITFFILKWFWWAFILGWIVVLKLKWNKWPIEAIIYEKRGDNLVKTNDRAGRYKDHYTGHIGYRLQKANDTIPMVNFDTVLHNNANATTLLERFVNMLRGNAGTISLFRYGSKQYKPIRIVDNKGNTKIRYQEMKDADGKPILVQVYHPIDPRKVLGVLDFEVVDWDNMNQMVSEWKASIERRKDKKEFWKQIVIPAIILGVVAIVCIVMLKFSADWTPKVETPTESKPAEAPKIPVISSVMPG